MQGILTTDSDRPASHQQRIRPIKTATFSAESSLAHNARMEPDASAVAMDALYEMLELLMELPDPPR